MARELVDRIYEALGSPEEPRPTPISQDTLKRWIASDDIDALGAIHAALHKPSYARRVTPPLNFDEYASFALHYLARCLKENPDSEWASTRYEAGWELASWFSELWDDASKPRTILTEIKALLADLYRSGDDALRRAIVNATLEHLFERREIATFFEDWERDPLLASAYRDARLWSEKGGTSDLHPKRRT
jgi:hypothetical protein